MDKYIIVIKGGAFQDVKKALRQWIDLYQEELSEQLVFEIGKIGRGEHVILVDKRLSNDNFYFLVNYLVFPVGITYKVDVVGYTVGKEDNELKNQRLLIHIPAEEDATDVVYATTIDHESYKIDFGGEVSKAVSSRKYVAPELVPIKDIQKLKVKSKKERRDLKKAHSAKIGKRFKVILIIAVIAYFLHFVLTQLSIPLPEGSLLILNILVAIWFFTDYELFREPKYYLYCFMISLGVVFYGHLIIPEFNILRIDGILVLYPMTFLLIQWPLRQIYKLIFKIEPKVDRYGNWKNFIYTFILIISFIVGPILLIELLKNTFAY